MTFAVLGLLAAAAAGSQTQVCAGCHRAEAKQAQTPMAHALEAGRDCAILQAHPVLTFREGNYTYTIRREGNRSTYTVSDGKDTVAAPIAWAFGLGSAGQTYVFEQNGALYESRVSYYKSIDGLDMTTGARNAAPRNLEEAAGRKMEASDARACFDCHATGVGRGTNLALDTLIPGVQCERCHENAGRHAQAIRAGDTAHAAMAKLGSLSTEELSDFCGSCHRTWSQVAAGGPHSVLNVRFQPYRLTNSKCYDASDRRIACTACHDAHDHTSHDVAFYDSKCQACHSAKAGASAKMCRVGRNDCASCHMPKTALPGAHFEFTDHRIRVARAGDPYPN